MVVAISVVLALGACGEGDDDAATEVEDTTSTSTTSSSTTSSSTSTTAAPPVTQSPVVTQPAATQPPRTQPPQTAPPQTSPPQTEPPAQQCHPSYSGCLDPSSSDYDCAGGSGNGPDYVTGPVQVHGSDPFGLDSDGDGVGCES